MLGHTHHSHSLKFRGLVGLFTCCMFVSLVSCKNNSSIEETEDTENPAIGGGVTVSQGVFDEDVAVTFSSVDGHADLPAGKTKLSSEKHLRITDEDTGEIVDPASAKGDIAVTIETDKITNTDNIEIFVRANLGTVAEETYTIPQSEITFEALGGGKYKVTFVTRETNAIFVVVSADSSVSASPSPSPSPSPTPVPAQAPTDISMDNQSVDEKLPSGTLVGNFASIDSDSATHTYSLVSGSGSTGNASFVLVGNQLKTAATIYHSQNTELSIRVRSTDPDANTYEEIFTITVTDTAEAWQTREGIETSAFGASSASIDFDNNGNAIAVWGQNDGTRDNIAANFYTAGSGWGTPVLIESNNSGHAHKVDVAFNSDGNAIAVWMHYDGTRFSVWSNLYTAGAGWGTPELVESDDSGDAMEPRIVADGNRNAIAVWQQSDGTRDNIWANIYAADTGWGTPELIETDNAGAAYSPQIAVDPFGNAMAVWRQSDGTRANIWANYFSTSTGWGTAELLESDNAGQAFYPEVAFDGAGNALALWQQSDGTRYNIWSNYFTPGSGWGGPVLVETDNIGHAQYPTLAFDKDNQAVALWHQTDGTRDNVWANYFSADTGWGTPELIEADDAGHARHPRIAFNGGGHAQAVFTIFDGTRDNVWASSYSASAGWGTPELLETANAGGAQRPQVAFDHQGNAISIWYQHNGSYYDVFVNYYR